MTLADFEVRSVINSLTLKYTEDNLEYAINYKDAQASWTVTLDDDVIASGEIDLEGPFITEGYDGFWAVTEFEQFLEENYPEIIQTLDELYAQHKVEMTEEERTQFVQDLKMLRQIPGWTQG